MTRLLAAAAVVTLVLLAGACAPEEEAAPEAASPSAGQSDGPMVGGVALRPVALPDLSRMVTPVQQQIEQAHAAVLAALGAPGTDRAPVTTAYGELGRMLLAADYPESAEPAFLNARTLDADDYRWPYYLAHIYRERGQLEQAREFLEEVLALQSDDLDALVWLGNVSLALGQPDAAAVRFGRALELAPASLSARFGAGRTALAKQDYATAVEHLTRVLDQDPEAAAAHYPLGLAYQGLGDAARASAHLQRREDHQILPADPLMVELDELLESPQAYETRGIRALDREAWEDAAAFFRKGLEIDPASAALHHRLGTALFMMENHTAAREEFEEAVRRAPDYFPAQYSLGIVLQDAGRPREAIERFEAALQVRPTWVEARLRLAANLRRVGRADEAVAQYAEALALDPDQLEAHFGSAMALVQLERYRDARDRLSAARRAYPDANVFEHALARVLAGAPDAAVRNGEEATRIVEELMQSEQRTLDLGETMAMALAASGRYADAASLQRELMRAAEGAGLSQALPGLAANLAHYEQGRPAPAPWPEGQVP